MVSTLYNDPQRYVLPAVYYDLLENDIIPQLFTHVPVQGPKDVKEFQFANVIFDKTAYLSEVLEYIADSIEFYDAKARKLLIQKDATLNQVQWRTVSNPRGRRKELIAKLWSWTIKQGNESFAFMGNSDIAHGFLNGFFNLVADASSSVNKPADTCSTGGTADTGVSWSGGNRGTEALQSEFQQIFKELNAEGFIKRVKGLTTIAETMHFFFHSLAWEIVAPWKLYNGASYGDKTIAESFKDQGFVAVTSDIIDSDYAGADDGATQLVAVPDIKKNFIRGVIDILQQEPWRTLHPSREHVSKVYMGIVQFCIPKWNGAYWKKAVHVTDIVPLDTAA